MPLEKFEHLFWLHKVLALSVCLILLLQSSVKAQPVNGNPGLKSYNDERNPDLSYAFS